MKSNPTGRAIAAILFLSLAAALPIGSLAADPAEEDPVARLEADSEKAWAEDDALRIYVANMKLLELRPYEADYMVNVVRAAARLDRRSVAYHFMLEMQQQGLSHDFNVYEDTENIRDSEAYEYINELLVEAGKAAGEGELLFELPGPASDLGGMTWDPSRERLLVGTISEGKLLAVDEEGRAETLFQAPTEGGPWSIGGLAVDVGANRLWLASSATLNFHAFSPARKGGHAVFEYTLDTLQPVARHDLPADQLMHDLGKMAVTGDGIVYVIDQAQPIVFRLKPGARLMEPFVASTDLVRLTDLAVTPDNSRLFAADAAMGIWVIDPVAQQAGMMTGPETLNLGGITGLEFEGGNLFLIQGKLAPQRLLRLQLDDTGSQVAEVSPMAIALEPFDGPARVALRNDGLVYVANAASSDPAASALILHTPLDAGSEIEPPNLRQFQRQMEENQQQ